MLSVVGTLGVKIWDGKPIALHAAQN